MNNNRYGHLFLIYVLFINIAVVGRHSLVTKERKLRSPLAKAVIINTL